MKKNLLRFGSYVLVAALATVITLAVAGTNPPSKLDRLGALMQERFIGEADAEELEDAAAAAAGATIFPPRITLPIWSRRKMPMWVWALPSSRRKRTWAS